MNDELTKPSKAKETDNSNRWQLGNGWLGIIPGLTKLDEVITKFGEPTVQEVLLNATSYQFLSGTIQVMILNEDPDSTVATMRILSQCPIENSIPSTIEDAIKVFGDLKQNEVAHSGTVIFQRLGFSLGCQLFGNPPQVEWIEFYKNAY